MNDLPAVRSTVAMAHAHTFDRPRTPNLRRLAAGALVIWGLGVAAGLLVRWSGWFSVGTPPHPSPWQLAVASTAFGAAAPLALLVHELGHLLAGALAGYQPFLLIVGPFRFEHSATRWHLRRNRDLRLYGGLAGATPRGMLETDRLRRA